MNIDEERIQACVDAFEGIPTEFIKGRNIAEILFGDISTTDEITEDGGKCFTFNSPLITALSETFVKTLDKNKADNYLELRLLHPDEGILVITLQKQNGKTPAQLVDEIKNEMRLLKEQIEETFSRVNSGDVRYFSEDEVEERMKSFISNIETDNKVGK